MRASWKKMGVSERKPVIVTFKTRAEPEVILESSEAAGVPFISATTLTGVRDLTPDIPSEEIGLVLDMAKAVSASLPETAIEELKKNPDVEMVEPDTEMYAFEETGYIERAPLPMQPIQPVAGWPYRPLPRCGYTDRIPWGVNRIDAERAWEVTQGKGIRVAVADTGIDYKHEDLRQNYRTGVSFVPGESDPIDHNKHGTHVAGTIAAARNCRGVVGVAPSAYLYAVKVLNSRGSGRFSFLIAGLEWCIKNKMDVVNMSLGASMAPTAVGRMCDIAYGRGVLLVAAAGNCYGKPVAYPAKYKSVIAVSAIDNRDNWAPFSCQGPEVELCAPGVNVLSTLPGNRYGNLSGTSMASPHVAGTAALAISSHRFAFIDRAPTVIRRLLAHTADNLGAPGRDPKFGFGLVDAEQAAFERRIPPVIPGIP